VLQCGSTAWRDILSTKINFEGRIYDQEEDTGDSRFVKRKKEPREINIDAKWMDYQHLLFFPFIFFPLFSCYTSSGKFTYGNVHSQ